MKRICVDLDGVICELKKDGEGYGDLAPLPGAVDKLRALRTSGHYIIIHTARHMKTCGGNTSLALARIGQITFAWLDKHQVPFDEIVFGKPWADVYIDDNALRFAGWEHLNGDGSNLPVSHELLSRAKT